MICLLGKTASGKTTIRNELVKLGYKPIITYTTRPMRDGEVQDVDYHFVTEDKFNQMIEDDMFAEYTSYITTSGVWYYGSAKADYVDDAVIILNPFGFNKICDSKLDNVISIYLKVDDEIILDRLEKRGDNMFEAKRRMGADLNDFFGIEKRVDFVLRNDLGIEVDVMASVIDNIVRYTNYVKN